MAVVFVCVMQACDYDIRLPRVFIDAPLREDAQIPLGAEQAHYLKTVMRRPDGSPLHVFNGSDGEWLASFVHTGKRGGHLQPTKQLRSQPQEVCRLHLVFSPIKKDRMDFMIEKAVELGVTDIHPVLTRHSAVRELNMERMARQIIEAAEQSERLDIPRLRELQPLSAWLQVWKAEIPAYAAIERVDAPLMADALPPVTEEAAFLIGPEGGFSDDEKILLLEKGHGWIKPVSLGRRILRAETAAIFGLSILTSRQHQK